MSGISNEIVLNAVDASASSQSSSPLYTAQCSFVSAHVIAVGTLVGVLKIQASNDLSEPLNGSVITNWVDIPSVTVSVSAAGNFLIPATSICYQYLRFVYTKTSSTGTPTVTVKVKTL